MKDMAKEVFKREAFPDAAWNAPKPMLALKRYAAQ